MDERHDAEQKMDLNTWRWMMERQLSELVKEVTRHENMLSGENLERGIGVRLLFLEERSKDAKAALEKAAERNQKWMIAIFTALASIVAKMIWDMLR